MAEGYIPMNVDHSADKRIEGIRYVRGYYIVQRADTMLHRIQDFIDLLDDSTTLCCFDVIINSSGQFRFSGYIYPGKLYGAGVVYAYGGYLTYWSRNNGIDTSKNVQFSS